MDRALDILKQYYGYSSFRDGQEEIIREILNGNDVLTIMPTGGSSSAMRSFEMIWIRSLLRDSASNVSSSI